MKIKLELNKDIIDKLTNQTSIQTAEAEVSKYLESLIKESLIRKQYKNFQIEEEKQKYMEKIMKYRAAKKRLDIIIFSCVLLLILSTIIDSVLNTKNYVLSLIITLVSLSGLLSYLVFTNLEWKQILKNNNS